MRFSVDCRRHRIHRRFEGALTRTYTRALLGLAPLRPLLYSAAQPKSRGGSFSFRIREEPARERRPCQLSSGTGGGGGIGLSLLRTVGTVLNDGDPRVVNKNLARRGLRGSCARQWNRVHSSHGCGLIRSESLAEHFGSRLRSLAECDGGPRSDHARFLLPLTERLNVCHHALGRREGFARTNLRLRHGLRAATWQQNQNEAKPEYRSQKEPHITPLFPGCFPSTLQKTSVEIARELLCVHGEVAVAVAGSESPSETHTLESYCDWRLTKR
jgi:hypothetical protein